MQPPLPGGHVGPTPRLLPLIGPLVRAAVSSDAADLELQISGEAPSDAAGMRSWRAYREELPGQLPGQPSSSEDERSRVTVPTNVAAVLQATLGGLGDPCGWNRCFPTVWRVRLWCDFLLAFPSLPTLMCLTFGRWAGAAAGVALGCAPDTSRGSLRAGLLPRHRSSGRW